MSDEDYTQLLRTYRQVLLMVDERLGATIERYGDQPRKNSPQIKAALRNAVSDLKALTLDIDNLLQWRGFRP